MTEEIHKVATVTISKLDYNDRTLAHEATIEAACSCKECMHNYAVCLHSVVLRIVQDAELDLDEVINEAALRIRRTSH